MKNIKKLLTNESIDAYMERFNTMLKYRFTEKGDELFIEKMVAESEQVNNLHVRTKIKDLVIENDEPEELGGTNIAPRPMETLLASLANCLEISALLYFSFSNLKIKSVKVRVEASFDKRAVLIVKEAPLPGFYDFNYTWYIDSEENIKSIKNVLKKVERNCPVKGTMSRSSEFTENIILFSKKD